MNKDFRIEKPIIYKRILAILFNLVTVGLSTLILYFLLFMQVFESTINFSNNLKNIEEIEQKYSLNINSNDYKDYKEVVEDFYFNSEYSKDIIEEANKKNDAEYSIYYIFNVEVLKLPRLPDATNYKTEYFTYKLSNEGEVLIDEVGVMAIKDDELSSYGRQMIFDIYKNGHSSIYKLLYKYDQIYRNSFDTLNYITSVSLVSSYSISVFIFYILVPLFNREKDSLGYQLFNLTYVNFKGYKVSYFIKTSKNLVSLILFGVGLYFPTVYGIFLLIIGPMIFELILVSVSNNKRDIFDSLFKIDCCSLKDSLVFKNKNHENEYIKNVVSGYEDPEFIERISFVEEINVKDERHGK